MKHKISIRFFILIFLLIMGFVQIVSLYQFYHKEKRIVGHLASVSVKETILNVYHIVKKTLQKQQDIKKSKAKIDNIKISNNFIKNIIITDDKAHIIYSSQRSKTKIPKNVCNNLKKYDKNTIFLYSAYKKDIELYRGIKRYVYFVYVVTDKDYINKLVMNALYETLIYFFIMAIITIGLFWVFFERDIIIPLEKLRQFAYYHTQKPKEFLIKELESIRYSLDITFDRLEKEQRELYNLSTKDSLSGLYNRLSLFDKIDWLISKSKRDQQKFAILFIDLDDFKNINDFLGHDIGDEVLKIIANTIEQSVRDIDFVARIGGDEFVVVLPEYDNNMQIVEVANRIINNISKPITINDKSFTIGASIGIVTYPKNAKDKTELIKYADIAMYKAKESGKNQFYFFTSKLNESLHEKLSIQQKIKKALKNNYFELYYQPKVDMKSQKIVGCEALIRWNDPVLGFVTPDKFISIAEENGYIVEIGEWVLKEAAQQIKKWQDTPLKNLKLSFNVSAKQFQDIHFYEKIYEYTKDIEKQKLDIEITESVFLDNTKKHIAIIQKIKKLGITFSLDDFGTGYSSLSYLRDIPLDTIKIDKSFLDNFDNESGKSFIKMIINIGKILSMEVVAEGVEKIEQIEFLKSNECDIYQGYYFSKPLKLQEFEELVFRQL